MVNRSASVNGTVTTTSHSSSSSSSSTKNAVMHSALSAVATQHLTKYDGQFTRVEGWIKAHPIVDHYTTLVSSKSGLRKAHVFLATTLVALMFLIFGPIAKLFGSLIGVSYPAYKSVKAIENPSHEDDRKWLTYWVVFAVFSVARNFSGFILSWFPFYNVLELAILLWMMAPIKHNGSHFLYQNVLRPFVLKHIDTIDSTIDSVKTSFVQLGTGAAAPAPVQASNGELSHEKIHQNKSAMTEIAHVEAPLVELHTETAVPLQAAPATTNGEFHEVHNNEASAHKEIAEVAPASASDAAVISTEQETTTTTTTVNNEAHVEQ